MVTLAGNKRWCRTHIAPWWANQHHSLPYVNEPFNDPVALQEWQDLGYTQTKFTGDMYDMRNPEPNWVSPFRSWFPWQHFGWSVYRMTPGCVLPNHSDTYAKFRELFSITDPETIYRAVIFLEDWQSGHYLEIDETSITHWAAGDAVIWQGSTPHLAANIGKTNRYTLQITGISDENTLIQ